MRIAEIIQAIEAFAPRAFQEDWDNTGLQVGNGATECTGVLICVDVTPKIVDEAISLGCNLIVSHHPLIFKGLKHLTGSTPVEVSVMNAIAAGISVYSNHTAVDNTPGGVSYTMAGMLGVEVKSTLAPLPPRFLKLVTMVPEAHAESVRMALFDAGAGSFGTYDCCSYNVEGTGTFRALDGSHPFVGEQGEIHHEAETRIEVMLPSWLRGKVEDTLRQVHPYEMPAYEFMMPVSGPDSIGTGVVGVLRERLTARQFVDRVKAVFGTPVARCTPFPEKDAYGDDPRLLRVAMCGGSGGSMIADAVRAGAQAYVSSDIRYHDFVDYADRIFLVDIGHFESEQCTKQIFYQIITQKFTNFAVYKSKLENNPINYI
ncbi:MAG: Nif3-like dinuclear metal center hexameric protein [Bacteroidales bacterium]|nr:Nif3-like dinuclear metal center hexameric protein [Bacteroidales bacterium]